jgi:hypothetical protein
MVALGAAWGCAGKGRESMGASLNRGVPWGRLIGVFVVFLLTGVFASEASADTVTIQQSQTSPVVGESVTFTAAAVSDCPKTYTFTVDGTALPPQMADSITRSFSTAGSHTVSVDIPAIEGCSEITGSDTFTVNATLSGTISVSPDPPLVNQSATLTATQAGGSGNYTYAWDTDDNGSFDNGTDRVLKTTFTTSGPHVVQVKIDDDSGHETIVQRTLDVQAPSTSTTTSTTTPTTTAPSPPCVSQLDFQLSEFKTPGCFTEVAISPSPVWTTTSAVTLNGIPFPDFGQTFTITFPDSQDPGGRFTAPGSVIRLDNFKVFSGDIDWSLPVGQQGDEQDVTSFTVASGQQLFGLSVSGSVALRLGIDANGQYYATFSLSIQLPAGFSAGPDPGFGSVTGSASLRVDDAGIHYDGLKVEAANVWIGKLKVDEACFSFIPSGGQSTSPCGAPSLDGSPYITCASDSNTNRWNGNAVIELPGSGVQLAAFGGLANGQISELGGFVDNLGRRAPLAPNVYLNRVGVGLCLTPPPLTLRGDVGISIFPTTGDESLATINGHIVYTNSYPWTLEIGGAVSVLDNQVGTGSVLIDGWGDFAFDLAASVDLDGVASIDGDINGWVDPPSKQYAVSGSVNACINGLGCLMGSGVVSSTGVAGCIEITSTYQSPDLLITLGSPPTIGFAKDTINISAGVGYRWGASSPDIWANSCDLSSYQPTSPFASAESQPTRPFASAANAGVLTERVATGTTALAWRVHGTHGVPKLVIHGPHGTVITSSAHSHGAQRKGHWMLAENAADGTTNVLLLHPPAGTWTVQAVHGTDSIPTKIDQAKFEAPPTLAAGVRANGAFRTLELAYAVPPGASVRLIERGKGVERTLVRAVHGRRCKGAPAKRPGSNEKVLCFTLRFRPSAGPAGRRQIQALVSKGGVPLLQKDIASFHAPALTLPSRPRYLLARRTGANLRVAFTPSRGASRYLVSASLSDGAKLAYDLKPGCQAVLIEGVPTGVSAKVKIAGMRFDEAMGKSRSVSIKVGVTSVIPKGKLPRTLKSPRKICS